MTLAVPRVGCVVLAAGQSMRFGSDKRLARLPSGLSLLEQTLNNAASVFEHRLLILRPDDSALAQRFTPHWHTVPASTANLGMGHSLAAALPHIQQWDAVVVILADMPWVQPATLQQVRAAAHPAGLVVPYYEQRRGNPVAIGKRFFAALRELSGDQGARGLLQRHAEAVLALPVDDAGILRDVDTPQGLEPSR